MPTHRTQPAVTTRRPCARCQSMPEARASAFWEGSPRLVYHQARAQKANCPTSDAEMVLVVTSQGRWSFSSTALRATFSSCCWKLVVMSPRVRSVTPRTMSVVRRRLPVMASGKSTVTSNP
jgi:hypothetical protein